MKTIILILILLLGSCSKDDQNLTPAGIETRVYGKITSPNGEPISNLIIKIGEYTESGGATYPSGFGSTHLDFVQFVKEVLTDSQGNYDFIFNTSGRGNFHKIKGKYLQLYLNEFVYKLNRRYFEEKLFDRLVIASITGL